MANVENLQPVRTEAEAREKGRAGGIASGKARRQRKTLAQIGDMIGGLAVNSEKNREIMRQAGISDEDMVRDVEAMFRLSLKASSGDTKAIELLAKLRGQFKEVQSVEVAEIQPLVDLTKRKKNGNSQNYRSE